MEYLSGIKFLDLISELFIKSSLILGISLFLVFLLRKKSAALKHFILSFSLISLLLFPVFSSITTGWETRWLPSWQDGSSGSSIQNQPIKSDPLIPLKYKAHSKLTGEVQKSDLEQTSNKSAFLQIKDIKILLGLSLLSVWLAGMIFLTARIILGLYGAHRLTRQGKRISESIWQLLLQRFLQAVSLKRKISLFSHEKVWAPLTWGIITPIVIMPIESSRWTKDQQSSALFHELSHIKRSDFLIKILARVSCALYWFNPLSWLAFSLIKKEQEKACDELVLKAGIKPSTYAANLLSIKKSGQFLWNPPTAVLSAVGKSQLNERLLAILKQQLKPKEVKMKTKILFSFFIIAAIAVIGTARCSQATAMNETNLTDNQAPITDTQQPIQAVEAQETTEQEKKQETAEEKDKKKEIKWVSKDGKTASVNVWVDKDTGTKKIILEGEPVIIVKKDDPKKGVILSISGKDVVLIKSEDGKWTLKSDVLHLIKEDDAKVIKLIKGKISTIKIEKGKDGKNVYLINYPYIHIKKVDEDLKSYTLHITGEKEGKTKKVHIAPHIDVHTITHLGDHPVLHLKTENKKLKEKLKILQKALKKIKELKDSEEQAKVQKETLKAVEEALKEINNELKNKPEKLKDLNIKIRTDIKNKIQKRIKIENKVRDRIKLIKKFKGDHTNITIDKDRKIIGFFDENEGFQMIIKSRLDSENKAKYEEILKKLKTELPEGYEVESKINEEENTILIKIKTGKKGEESSKKIRELIKKVIDKLNKIEKETSKKEITSV